MPIAAPAIPPNPRIPAIIEIIKNVTAHPNMIRLLLCYLDNYYLIAVYRKHILPYKIRILLTNKCITLLHLNPVINLLNTFQLLL